MHSASRSHRVPGWLILIGAMSAVGPVSIDMYLPAFPQMESDLAQQGVEQTMASYLIGLALGQLLYGPISDRFGRKPPLYVGFVLYVIGALGCAIASSMGMLVLMRVLQALGACSSLVIGRAIVRDRCQPEEAARAFSTLMLIVSLGPILAPILGGWVVTAFGWRAVFFFQVALGLSLLIAMHVMLTESRDPAHVVPLSVAQMASSYGRLLADRQFMGYACLAGFSTGALFSFVAGAPTVMTHLYGLSPQQFGWLIGLNGIAFMSASRLNIIELRWQSPAEVLARAIWVPVAVSASLSVLAVLIALPLWLMVALQFSFFISVGRVNPNVAALALAPHGRMAGSASSLMGALQSAVATLCGVAIAMFNDGTILPLALVMMAGATGAWLSYGAVKLGNRS